MKFGEVWISALCLGLLCNIETDGQRTNDPIWYGPMAVRPSVWELKQTEQPNDHFQSTLHRTDNQIKLPAINHVAIDKNYDQIGRKQSNFNFPNKLYSRDIQQSKINVWGPGNSQQKEDIDQNIKFSEPKHEVSNTEKSFHDNHSVKNSENDQLMPQIILAEFNPHQDGITVSTHGIDVTNFQLYNPGSTLVSPIIYNNERNNQEDLKNKLDGQYKKIDINYSSKNKQENRNIDDKTGENVQIEDKRRLPDTYRNVMNSAWTQDGYGEQIPNIRQTDKNSQFFTENSKPVENPRVSGNWQGGLNHPMSEDNSNPEKNLPNSEIAWSAEKNSQNSLNSEQGGSNHENADEEWKNERTVHISEGIWEPSDIQHKLNGDWRPADGQINQSERQEPGQQENKDSNYHSDINQSPSFGNWQPEKNQHTSDKDWSANRPHQNDGNLKQTVYGQVSNENWNQDGYRDESNGERSQENRPIVNSPNNLKNNWVQQEKVDRQNWKPESNFRNEENGRNSQDWQPQVHSRDVNIVEDNMQAWFPNQSPDSTQEKNDDWNANDRQLNSPFDHDQRYNPDTSNKENSFDGHKPNSDHPQYNFQKDIGSLSDQPIENNWKSNEYDEKNSNPPSHKDIFFSRDLTKIGDRKNLHGVNNEFNEETYNQPPIKGDNHNNFDTNLRQPESNRFNLNTAGKNGDPASTVSSFNRGIPQGNYKGSDGDRYPDEGPTEVSFESTIPGTAGVDYPNYTSIPQTEFNCANHNYPGYFADTVVRCQVYHVCQSDGRHNSFLCPIGTIFNQKLLTCDWWFQYDCTNSANFYSLNQMLYRESDPQGNYKGSHFEGTRMPQVFPQIQPPPPETHFLLPENNNLGDSRKVLTNPPDFPGNYQFPRGDDLPLGEIPDIQGIISRDGNRDRINKIHPLPGNADNIESNNPYNGNTFDDKFTSPERYPSINLDNEINLPGHNSGTNSDDGWIQQGHYPEVNLNNGITKPENEFRPKNNMDDERIMPESHSKDNGWIQQEYNPENDLNNDWVQPEHHPNNDLQNGRIQPGQYPQTDLDNERLRPEYHPNTDVSNERIQPDQYTQTNLDNRRPEHTSEDLGSEDVQPQIAKPQLNDGWVNTESHQNPHLDNAWMKQDESNTKFGNKWNESFEPEITSGNVWKNNEQDTGQKDGHNQIIKPNVNDEDQRNTPDQAKTNLGNEWSNKGEVKLNTGNGWSTPEQVKIDVGNEWYTPQQVKINVESQWKEDDSQFRSKNNGQWSDLEQSKLNPDNWNRNYDHTSKSSNDWNGDRNNENAWIEDRMTEMPHYSDLKENNDHFNSENGNYNTRRQDVNFYEEDTDNQWKYPDLLRKKTEQTEQIVSEKDRISLVDRSSESTLESIRLPTKTVENENTKTTVNRGNDSSDRARMLISRTIGNLDELRQKARWKVEEDKKISNNEDDVYSQNILHSKESTDINAAQENHTFPLNEMDTLSEGPIYESVLKQKNDFDFKITDKEKLSTTESPLPNSENMNKNGNLNHKTTLNIANDEYDANLDPKNDLKVMNRMKNILENQTATSSISDDRNSMLNYNENQFDPKREELDIVEQLTSQKDDEFIPLGSNNFFTKNNEKGNIEKNKRVQNSESGSSGIRKGRQLMYRIRKRAKFGSMQDASMFVKGLNQGSAAEESIKFEIVALPSNIPNFTSEVTANAGNLIKLRDKDDVSKFPKTFEKIHFPQASSILPLKMPRAGTSILEIDHAERTNVRDRSKSSTRMVKELREYGTRISKIASSD